MKKRLVAILSIVLALVISTASFSGCNLVTTNSERDMDQTVATVQISEKSSLDEIKKKDMIMAYLNYGYMYVQYYGYTQKRTFTLILDNLISTRIMVQNAILSGEEKNVAGGEDYNAYPAAKYLDETQLVSAKYNAIKAMNDLIDSNTDDGKEDKVGDSVVGTVRTVPSGAKNAEKKVTDEEKKEYIDSANKKTSLALSDMGNEYRRKAYNDVVKLFKNNALLGEYDGKDLKTTDYYKQTLKSFYENELVTAYQEKIENEERAKYTFQKVADKYKEIYDKQKEWSNADFVTALGKTSATEPVLYCAYGNYGYVYNLLLGVNDYQKADIEKIKSDNPNVADDAYAAARKDILANTVVSDLRSSWILSGYDGELAEGKFTFTGDYTFTSAANSLAFQGEVVHLNADEKDEDDYTAQYGVKSVKYFGLEDFVTFMNGYLGGTDAAEDYNDLGDSVYDKKLHRLSGVEEYDEKVKELIFAFSTDSGSLSNPGGYVIKPNPDGSNSEEYVTTFAEAGRKLLSANEKQSYVIVASDYGYHIMFFSKVLGVESDDLKEYLKKECGIENAEEYFADMMADYEDFEDKDNYLYVLTDSIVSTAVQNALTKAQTALVNKYRYEEKDCVKIFENTFSDLLG